MFNKCENNCPAFYSDCEGQGCLFRNAEKQDKCKLPRFAIRIMLRLRAWENKRDMQKIDKNKLPF